MRVEVRWVARSPAWLEPGLAESPSRSIRPEARGARPGSAPLEKAPRQTPARTQLVPTRVAHSPAWQGVARAVRESISLWIDSLFLGSGPLRGADTYASSHADWRVSQCASMAASEQRESPGPPEAAEIGPDNRDNGCVWGGKSFGLQTTAPVTSRPPFLPSPGRCWVGSKRPLRPRLWARAAAAAVQQHPQSLSSRQLWRARLESDWAGVGPASASALP